MKHTCPYCQEEFEGRRNKKYCSLTCKNQAYYEKEDDMRQRNRHVTEIMNRNERILREYFKSTNFHTKAWVYKGELRQFGFNDNGPFWVDGKKYRVGNYLLEDYGVYYNVTQVIPKSPFSAKKGPF